MSVVYLDCVFIFNAVADYFLFLITARLAGIPLRRKRYLLAAVLGGIYACAVFGPGGEVLAAPLWKISTGILLALLAFGCEQKLFRLMILWVLVSCGFAGSVLGLSLLLGEIPAVRGIFYTHVNTKILAAVFASGYFLIALMFRSAAKQGIEGNFLLTRLWLRGKSIEFSALRDTGNTLCDLFSGKPILVVSPGVLQPLLSPAIAYCITPERLQDPLDLLEEVCRIEQELRPQLVPYHSVGKKQGVLFSIQVDQAEIGGQSYPKLRVALSPTELGSGYHALWGGEVRGRNHVQSISETQKVAVSLENGRRTCRYSLYRRK